MPPRPGHTSAGATHVHVAAVRSRISRCVWAFPSMLGPLLTDTPGLHGSHAPTTGPAHAQPPASFRDIRPWTTHPPSSHFPQPARTRILASPTSTDPRPSVSPRGPERRSRSNPKASRLCGHAFRRAFTTPRPHARKLRRQWLSFRRRPVCARFHASRAPATSPRAEFTALLTS
ncbi:hypothetical protein BC834DRAFT_504743 [Gloeopeniophorella convolvens]|nr:hypothetical protein BC834DRAFT_504743 [Gloeopeniophorella convolvens]